MKACWNSPCKGPSGAWCVLRYSKEGPWLERREQRGEWEMRVRRKWGWAQRLGPRRPLPGLALILSEMEKRLEVPSRGRT